MANELQARQYIEGFVSGGRKNNVYKIVVSDSREKKTVYEVRGIAINYSASQLANLGNIEEIIFQWV
jgi:hypothetical protein